MNRIVGLMAWGSLFALVWLAIARDDASLVACAVFFAVVALGTAIVSVSMSSPKSKQQ
jgi:hypothetical protein